MKGSVILQLQNKKLEVMGNDPLYFETSGGRVFIAVCADNDHVFSDACDPGRSVQPGKIQKNAGSDSVED